jgi:hypothetical protein
LTGIAVGLLAVVLIAVTLATRSGCASATTCAIATVHFDKEIPIRCPWMIHAPAWLPDRSVDP